ncbi:MAG: hypothetical protein RDU76_01365 [Candidatus Edwardsbacteria bacterium]|nr:hypothetical protein [Candidatus Edwardsbacteria bacterium]
MYEPNDQRGQWAFGWGKNLETELEWSKHLSKHIYSYSVRWKVPFDSSLQNGLFTEAYYSSYTNGKHLNINLGYVYNINKNLSIIPRLKLQGSSNIALGISATWVPLKFISGNLGAENIFDNKSGTNINAQMSLKIRFWKGIFVEEKFINGYESNVYYSEHLQQTLSNTRIYLRQEQYLGITF